MAEVTPLHGADPNDDDDELRAADGRVPGRRGRATRQRLLECTREMLAVTSYRDVKVIDIAREAGTSPATFYQYFADVEAAILVLAEDMAQEGQHLPRIITTGSWKGRGAYDTSAALVDAFLQFWDDNRPVLRVMDLATDEGDRRFQSIRVHLLNDITNALAEVTRLSQVEGRIPGELDPMATGGVLVSMLAHVAAHQYGFEFWGIRTGSVRDSMARQIAWGVTGLKPPG
jgi:AcrR family transcriptional regulator